jgi:hypothetical protein
MGRNSGVLVGNGMRPPRFTEERTRAVGSVDRSVNSSASGAVRYPMKLAMRVCVHGDLAMGSGVAPCRRPVTDECRVGVCVWQWHGRCVPVLPIRGPDALLAPPTSSSPYGRLAARRLGFAGVTRGHLHKNNLKVKEKHTLNSGETISPI